jgi:hypothetical protein
MTTYRIISHNTTLGTAGDTIADADLAGLNVDALVEGGHIEPIAAKQTKTKESDKNDNE